MLLLQELLPGLQQPPQLFDPAFTPLDAQLLQHMGLEVIAVNEEGRRSIGGQITLFYLPHCEVGWRGGQRDWAFFSACGCGWGGAEGRSGGVHTVLPAACEVGWGAGVAREIGCSFLPGNAEGRRSIGGQITLFYLLHCEVGSTHQGDRKAVGVGARVDGGQGEREALLWEVTLFYLPHCGVRGRVGGCHSCEDGETNWAQGFFKGGARGGPWV